ncbi:MAG: iron export ABC transporter permease subunit FetB [Deltaproteobacteria bacterium]|nr:iron export ABC transporter permease subunit FetB [Deltaproteobacteria bacterium]
MVVLSAFDVALASGLVLVAGIVSLGLGLRLERRLGLAALHTVVQLLLIGHVLRWVFSAEHVILIFGMMLLMVVAAARSAVQRPSRTFRGMFGHALFTLALTGFVATLTVTHLIIGIEPWYQPRYLIPLLGMILGNSLTGLSLCLDHLLEAFDRDRASIEMELALGASRWEAAEAPMREAVRKGMMPTINTMTVVGVVSLPGLMTGQILAGADPMEAVMYQIVVMFMIAVTSALGSMLISVLAYRAVFDRCHRLRSERVWLRSRWGSVGEQRSRRVAA